jgi:hypothetical protein
VRSTKLKSRQIICCLFLATTLASSICASGTPHKSEAEIAKLTPDQRVQEYCDEYYHHAFWDSDYIDMVKKYILQDGAKSLPAITQIINEFDPTNPKGKSRQKDARAFAAEGLLSQVDGRVIRLRAIPEGRTAIDAMSRSVQRMLAAHFDTADVNKHEYSDRYRYEASRDETELMRGLNFFDRAIQDTLRIQYKTKLSDPEMLDFVNYLISQEPRYPSWSTLENYKDLTDRNEAGYPRQYLLLKNMEPFYKAYEKYKRAR